jgi:hypothetical protein
MDYPHLNNITKLKKKNTEQQWFLFSIFVDGF